MSSNGVDHLRGPTLYGVCSGTHRFGERGGGTEGMGVLRLRSVCMDVACIVFYWNSHCSNYKLTHMYPMKKYNEKKWTN